jgi:hypothetical protein
MANTTLNPADKAANVTLSGGNLIAAATTNAVGIVRAIDKQITGKFYWEATLTTNTAVQSGCGVASLQTSLTQSLASQSGPCALFHNGAVYSDGVQFGSSIFGASVVSGVVVGMALDLASRQMWFRLGAAGFWNANAGANPATGVGGVYLPGLGPGAPVYPALTFGATSDAATLNFGDSAFTGVVPSGFTSGFPAGATAPNYAVVTQTAVEEWVSGTGVAAIVTQTVIEEWASVAAILPSLGAQTRVMVMA